jgi:hypothetical protein
MEKEKNKSEISANINKSIDISQTLNPWIVKKNVD